MKPQYDFRPVVLNQTVEKINRPLLTYWQDAYYRFKKRKSAVAAASFILFIALLGGVGPFFFPKVADGIEYYNHQNPDFRNQYPTFGSLFLVIPDEVDFNEDQFADDVPEALESYSADNPPPAPSQFRTEGLLSVNGVQLFWEPVPGVSGYEIYRTFLSKNTPTRKNDQGQIEYDLSEYTAPNANRGVLIAHLPPEQISVTDFSGLNPSEKYVYTIVSLFEDPQTGETIMSSKASGLAVELQNVIVLSEALKINPNAQVGEIIRGRMLLFGTDPLGRDIFARMIQGTRIDFFLALIVPICCFLIGLIYGAISAFKGGFFDLIMMRIIEILDTVPDVMMMILIQVVLGRGAHTLLLALILFSWQSYARVLRAEVLKLKHFEFVEASRLMGLPLLKIIRKHIAPNVFAIAIVQFSNHIPRVIIAEAVLSLLGLGIPPPEPTWGTVIQEAGNRFQVNPMQFFLPAGLMCVTLIAFFILGDTFRDVLDPKMRGRK